MKGACDMDRTRSLSRRALASWALAFVAIAGCRDVDDTDLAKTVAFYHAQRTTQKQRWRLLSKESRDTFDERSRAAFLNADTTTFATVVEPPEILAARTVQRRMLVPASVTVRRGDCVVTETRTWLQEDGRWRVLRFGSLAGQYTKEFTSGDYAAAVQTAERMLELNPLSIEAHEDLLFALSRSGSGSGARGVRSNTDLVRSALAINSKDHDAIFIASTFSLDASVCANVLRQLPAEACRRSAAVFNCALTHVDAASRLGFLDRMGGPQTPALTLMRLESVWQLGEVEGLQALATPSVLKDVLDHLAGGDGAYAAAHAAEVASVLLLLQRFDEAQDWLEFGVSRDPTNEDLSVVALRLRDARFRVLRLELSLERAPERSLFRSNTCHVGLRLRNPSDTPLDWVSVLVDVADGQGAVLASQLDFTFRRLPIGGIETDTNRLPCTETADPSRWRIAKARVRKAWVETPAGKLDLAEHFQVRIVDPPSSPPRP